MGRYTIDNYAFLNPFAATPRAFTAAFGDQPSPSTVATSVVQTTSTATNTAFAPVRPAATTTVSSASATSTQTNIATSTFPVTSAVTQTFTVCPTSIRPSSSSSSPAPIVPSPELIFYIFYTFRDPFAKLSLCCHHHSGKRHYGYSIELRSHRVALVRFFQLIRFTVSYPIALFSLRRYYYRRKCDYGYSDTELHSGRIILGRFF
ncbi:uncharacterized protein J4E88_009068 [Alternaria novae-zelandiae]|uniref:uncharacterized protein n=1 Tax=Alternaria novae-zelandiae TaxID=430562 RepID=UPI0020C4CA96|nr:uncharacterized protein J4E88_009068 [Alternaria novae-zelandiae]KAI4671403.1 hypothetical protein J4E88_009068 [Alternaria novae-zelandiae]